MKPLVSILVLVSISAAFGLGYATNAYGAFVLFGLALLVGLCMQRVRAQETILILRFGRLRRMDQEGYFLFIPPVDRMIDVLDRGRGGQAANSAMPRATEAHDEISDTGRVR